MFGRLRTKLSALPERWSWLGLLVAVHRRFSEINGGFVASALTLSIFLSLFPLLLVALAVIGFLGTREDFATDAISQLGLTGEAARTITDAIAAARDNRASSSIIGLAGLLWSGLNVVGAIEHALNTTWQVKGRGLIDKAYGLLWLGGIAVLITILFTLTGLINVMPWYLTPLAFVVSAAMHAVGFLWTAHVLGGRDVGWRPLVPGAVSAGVGIQTLTTIASIYVPRAVASSSALYGSIGVVFAILAWLFFFGRLFVYASALNVVLFERERGTVTAEIQVPHLPDIVPLETTRAGAINEVAEVPSGSPSR